MLLPATFYQTSFGKNIDDFSVEHILKSEIAKLKRVRMFFLSKCCYMVFQSGCTNLYFHPSLLLKIGSRSFASGIWPHSFFFAFSLANPAYAVLPYLQIYDLFHNFI